MHRVELIQIAAEECGQGSGAEERSRGARQGSGAEECGRGVERGLVAHFFEGSALAFLGLTACLLRCAAVDILYFLKLGLFAD